MRRFLIVLSLFCLNASGILFAQKAASPVQRYFRLICLVHLTGSGKAGDPVLPEYVAQGTAIAQAAATAGSTTAKTAQPMAVAGSPTTPTQPVTASAATSSRPGYLAWGMQLSDDGTMAIIHIVAADHAAFNSILADTRPEIRVFEIGKDSKATIETEMQKYKKNFDLESFQVLVQ